MISKQIEELEESRRITVDVEELLKQMTNEDVLSPLMDVDDEDNGGDTLEIDLNIGDLTLCIVYNLYNSIYYCSNK